MKENYNILDNEEFISWYENEKEKGYEPCASIEEIQDFIDEIFEWYEILYPDNMLDNKEELEQKGYDFQEVLLNVLQMLGKLNDNQKYLASIKYRSKSKPGTIEENIEDDILKQFVYYDIFNIKTNEKITLSVDDKTGIIYNTDDISVDKNTSIKELIKELKDDYNCKSLEKAIYNYKIDKKIREKAIRCICYKLLYSQNTTYEHGYERALIFLEEFDKLLGLDMTKNKLNELKETLKIK